jgi:hypothetical protein
MESRKVIKDTDHDRFEELEIQVKDPTIVVSVRLDASTAKQLGQLAQIKGQRLSDLLREAVTAYAATGGLEGTTYTVNLPGGSVEIGRASRTTSRAPREESRIEWVPVG